MGLQCAFQPALTSHLSIITASFLGPKGDHYRPVSLYSGMSVQGHLLNKGQDSEHQKVMLFIVRYTFFIVLIHIYNLRREDTTL